MDTIYYSMQEALEWVSKGNSVVNLMEALEWVSKCNSVVNLMVVFCLFLWLESTAGFQNLRWWDVITALLAK